MAKQKADGLEVEQDLEFQRRSWAVQRIGWIVMLVIVVAGLVGVFGNGPLSLIAVSHPGSVQRVEYQRFVRVSSPTTLRFSAVPSHNGVVQLRLSQSYLGKVYLERITPEPAKVVAATDQLLLSFDTMEANQPITIVMHLKPQGMGLLRGQTRIGNEDPLSLTQLVYP